MTDKDTINLGVDTTLHMKDQEARYLLGCLSYVEQNLGTYIDPDDLIVHLAEAGVNPEVDTELDMLSRAKASLNSRKKTIPQQAFKPLTFDPEAMQAACALPPLWMLEHLGQMKTTDARDMVFHNFQSQYPGSERAFVKWVQRTWEEKVRAECQAYGYLMAFVTLGILDADHAGELLEGYRAGAEYNP